MSSQAKQPLRPFRTLAVLAIAVWGLYAWWALGRVQSTGRALKATLEADWPADHGPRPGIREKLLETADEMSEKQAWAFGDGLAPAVSPTEAQRVAATKFLAARPELRARLLAITGSAEDGDDDGDDVVAVRDALARAYRGAVEGKESVVNSQLDRAEDVLAQVAAGLPNGLGPVDEQAISMLVDAIEPIYELSQDLMTEGGAAAEKVLTEAARASVEQRYADSAVAIRLAAELLGVQLATPRYQESGDSADAPSPAEWFATLAEREIPSADKQQATETVELAEAMALSITPGDTITALLKKARRELDGQRYEAAAWWASISLNAMGMNDTAIAAATAGNTESADETADEEGTQ